MRCFGFEFAMLVLYLTYLYTQNASSNLQPYLGSFRLHPPHTSRSIDYSVLRYDLTGVDLTEGSNYTATGEDYIPTNIS